MKKEITIQEFMSELNRLYSFNPNLLQLYSILKNYSNDNIKNHLDENELKGIISSIMDIDRTHNYSVKKHDIIIAYLHQIIQENNRKKNLKGIDIVTNELLDLNPYEDNDSNNYYKDRIKSVIEHIHTLKNELEKKKILEKDFFMIYVEGGSTPTCKHETIVSAITESKRLCKMLNKDSYILKSVIRVSDKKFEVIDMKTGNEYIEDNLPF